MRKMIDKMREGWKDRSARNNKMKFMRSFKDERGRSGLMESDFRSAAKLLMQIRSGTIELRVDRGRMERLERKDRTCRMCGEGVEDEVHFLMALRAVARTNIGPKKDQRWS